MKHLVFAGAVMLIAGCRTSSTGSVANDAHASPMPTESAAPVADHHSYPMPSAAEIKKMLTPIQYEVTQNDATEPPFRNEYWNNHETGIYVDVVTGQPLFASTDKFESGTGWPSFSKPIDSNALATKDDTTLGMSRTEVRSKSSNSHLGHVFDDGPEPTGLRYCMNSASLRFIPLAKLDAEGFGAYRARFEGGSSHGVVTATSNSCAAPPPGTRAGCSTTLETAIVAVDGANAEALKKTPGVLTVESGTLRGAHVSRVTYDPKALTSERLAASLPRGTSVHDGDDNAFTLAH